MLASRSNDIDGVASESVEIHAVRGALRGLGERSDVIGEDRDLLEGVGLPFPQFRASAARYGAEHTFDRS